MSSSTEGPERLHGYQEFCRIGYAPTYIPGDRRSPSAKSYRNRKLRVGEAVREADMLPINKPETYARSVWLLIKFSI